MSFGSRWELFNGDALDYNNATKDAAIEEVKTFAADYGGTDILPPLIAATEYESGAFKKRIFVLTDGETHNKD